MFAKYKKIIIVAIVLILLFIAYSNFLKPDEDEGLLIGKPGPEEVDIVGQDIAQALNRINSIKLDTNVFNSSVLNSLDDKSEPIIPEASGRRNPFEPYNRNGRISNNTANNNNSDATTTPDTVSLSE